LFIVPSDDGQLVFYLKTAVSVRERPFFAVRMH
jgi:hypothetical protein